MVVWHTGAAALAARVHETVMPIEEFAPMLVERGIPRVPGTAVFLTRTQRDAPPVMVWHVKHSRALHERVFILNVATEMVPYVSRRAAAFRADRARRSGAASARFGFMERPDMPALLLQARADGCAHRPSTT